MHNPTEGPEAQAGYVAGLIALRNGDAEGAVEALTEALRRRPEHPGIQRNLLRALLAAGRFEPALAQADIALATSLDAGELHFVRGTALNGLGRAAEACVSLTRAVALRPDHAPSWLNLANAWTDLDDLALAEQMCRRAIALDPDLPEAHASLGHILTMRGQTSAAVEACEHAIAVCPDFTQAHWNLAVATLLGGELRRGFAAFEWRKRHAPYRRDFPPLPGEQWDGATPDGRTILVRGEQGFGDVIQCARYLPLIRAAGGDPVLVCAPSMVRLLGAMPGVTAVSNADPLPCFDAWIDLLSLPHVFGTTLETIPAAGGYLQADACLVEAWRGRLPAGRKVGVAFAGNPKHRNDRRRSIPSDVRVPVIPGVTFVNLQCGPGAANMGLPDLTGYLTDYAETAALMTYLELVISVDTSVAHLAGALGKPTWVLLPAAPDWRWLLGRSDSPWYHSVRLIRQDHPGDWQGVLDRVARDLTSLPAAGTAGGVRPFRGTV